MDKEKNPGGFTVLDTVDIIKDRELPNCDPAHEGNRSFEQEAYFPNEKGVKDQGFYSDDD